MSSYNTTRNTLKLYSKNIHSMRHTIFPPYAAAALLDHDQHVASACANPA